VIALADEFAVNLARSGRYLTILFFATTAVSTCIHQEIAGPIAITSAPIGSIAEEPIPTPVAQRGAVSDLTPKKPTLKKDARENL
jgi:hypothetical protein